ncbi:thioredoxin-disulfide reductase [Patescibacteria group bacterium]
MYDTIIIGAGPAGFSAAIYAARREMKALVIGKEPGGQMIWATEIENYPGFKSIESFELINKMQEQVKNLNVEIKIDEVQNIKKQDDNSLSLTTTKEEFTTQTIIIAMGLVPRRLAIPGEEKLTGKGISYCANCDGPFFKGKTVAVIGGGNAALDAAEILSKIANKVYLVHRRQEFRAFEALVEEVKARKNIEMVLDCEAKEIIGETNVKKMVVRNVKTDKEKTIELDGIFIEVGRIAHTDLVADLVERDERAQIVIDDCGKTNAEGVFAAGDVTTTKFKQITIACGQGTIAALSAYQYIQLKQGKDVKMVLDRSKPKK